MSQPYVILSFIVFMLKISAYKVIKFSLAHIFKYVFINACGMRFLNDIILNLKHYIFSITSFIADSFNYLQIVVHI